MDDDTCIIISSINFGDFCSLSNLVLSHVIKWFAPNKLVLNLDRIKIVNSVTNNSPHSAPHIGYKEDCGRDCKCKFITS
jgi:hypothetical protein